MVTTKSYLQGEHYTERILPFWLNVNSKNEVGNICCFIKDCNKVGKVQLCHKGDTLYVGSPAVRAHLAHGDQLGSCLTSSAFQLNRKKGDASIVDEEGKASLKISNTPNPFQISTQIQYEIPSDGHVLIKIYDGIGREMATVINSKHTAGIFTKEFSTTTLPGGL